MLVRFLVFILAICCVLKSYASQVDDTSMEGLGEATQPCCQIQIKVLYGEQIAAHTDELCALILTAFREYPYLYVPHDNYVNFLKSYGTASDTIVAMAFDGDKLVGVATGIPLASAGEYQLPLVEKKYDPSAFFYMGELVVDTNYRKRGLGKQLYENLELAVQREGKYKAIVLCQMEDPRYDILRPTGYVATDGLWLKWGFEHHPEINVTSYWYNVGCSVKTAHIMVYWIKDLH